MRISVRKYTQIYPTMCLSVLGSVRSNIPNIPHYRFGVLPTFGTKPNLRWTFQSILPNIPNIPHYIFGVLPTFETKPDLRQNFLFPQNFPILLSSPHSQPS